MSPLVSVIVPVYNVERYLRRCLDSVLEQTLRDIEVVVVDDGSPDGSPAICDEYAPRDPRVKVIHKQNGGLGYARNSGIEVAEGEYIAFLDSDDYLEPHALERLYTLARENDLDVIRAARNEFVREGEYSHTVADSELQVFEGRDILRQIALCYFSQPNGNPDRAMNLEGSAWGALYARRLFADEGLRFVSERELVSEDFIFNYECALRSRRIGKLRDTLWHYRLNPESLTKTPRKDCLTRAVDYSQYLERRFREDSYGPESALYAMGYTVDTMRAHVKNIVLSPMPRREVRQWLAEQAAHPYFQRIAGEYPLQNLPRMQRLFFTTFYKRRFRLLELLIRSRRNFSFLFRRTL